MESRFTRKIAARLIFIISLFLMILGIIFLLSSLENTSRISIFLSFMMVVAGVFCAVLALSLNKRASYLFFGAFFLMTELFLFLSALGIIPLPISRAWPLLSVFSGLALLSAGWQRYGGIRPSYLVPSCAFVVLGCALLIFSFDMVPFSFRDFIGTWWPLILVLVGITLALIFLGGKKE